MARSQRHKRYTVGFDSTGSTRYPGSDYTWAWAFTWPSSSGQAGVTPPQAFQVGDWNIVTGASPNEIDLTVTGLPDNGGSPITDIQYDLNGLANWTTTGLTTGGSFTIPAPLAGTTYTVHLRAVNSNGAGLRGDGKQAISGADVPDAFVDANWSVATGSSPNELDVTIASLPATNGASVSLIEYDVDANDTWTTLGIVAPGSATITMAAVNTSYAIRLRATNSVGTGNEGNSESATSGAGAPDAFVDANWSVATGGNTSELDITIATLPATNGAAITDIEYDVDASGSWISLGENTTGTFTVTMVAASTSYAIRLRAVSTAGTAAAGNSESATSGAGAPTVPDAFIDAEWSIVTGPGDAQVRFNIATLPNNNGAAITDVEYELDLSGSWVSLGTAVPGNTDITMAAANTSYDARLRAINSVGNGIAGNTESATSQDAVADAFVDANWSVATGSGSDELDITIATLPANNGSTITDVEYDVDSSGTWIGLPAYAGTGTYTVTMADANTSYNIRLRAVNGRGNSAAGNIESATSGVGVADAFIDANWSIATGSGPAELDISIATLPDDNGSAITNVQYDIDSSGTWINIPSYAGTGSYTVTMAANSTSYDIRLRAVNGVGNAAAGNIESATSGSGAATAPSAFVDADWSVATGADYKELDITIATLPNNGGAVITDIEYDVDASGSWISLGTATTGTVGVVMAAASTSYGIRLRAVNSVGAAAAGNSESAASNSLNITGYSYNGTDTITLTLNGTGTLYTSTTVSTETDAADIEAGVAAIDTDSDAVVSGVNNVTVSYPNTFDDNWLNVVAKNGSDYSNVESNQYTFADIVPRAFVDANWSVATGVGSRQLAITIASLPSNGGATITDVEYDVDASGTWISLGTTTGTTQVTLPAANTSYDIRLRGVNSVGNGLTGNTESATSQADGPDAFVDANWSVATGSGPAELDITVTTLPADNGSAITDVQYDIDSGGSWTSLPSYSGTGTYTVTMASNSTSYDIRLRAVNAIASSSPGNIESATSGAAGGATPSFQAAGVGTGSSGAFTVAWPAHATNDWGVLMVQQRGNDVAPSAPSGWNPIGTATTGSGSTHAMVTVFERKATSAAEADVSIPDGGNHQHAQIITIRGATAVAQLGSNSSGSGTAVTLTSGTTGGSNRLIFGVVSNRTDTATDQITAWTNANLTSLTDRGGHQGTTAGGGGFDHFTGVKASSGAVGSTTATLATSSQWAGMVLEFTG